LNRLGHIQVRLASLCARPKCHGNLNPGEGKERSEGALFPLREGEQCWRGNRLGRCLRFFPAYGALPDVGKADAPSEALSRLPDSIQ